MGARIRIGIEAGDRGIVAAGHPAVAAVEFAAKLADAEAPGQPAAHRLVDPGQGSHSVGEPRRSLGVGRSLDQIAQEFASRISFDIGEVGVRHPTLAGLGFSRHRRHRGQAPDILQQAGAGEFTVVEQRRHQNEPPHAHSLVALQIAHDLRSANPAIAFTGDEFRRQQAIGFLQPAADHQRDRVGVAVDRIEPLARLLAAGDETAVAGADGIDEDQVGKVEPGLGVGHQVRRSGGRHRVGVDGEPPRAGRAELQPGGGRARPAIEQKGHRPGTWVGAVELVGREGDIGLRLALVVEQRNRAGGGGEVERPAGKRQRMPGGRIRRQPALLGDERIRRVAAHAGGAGLLSRWRCCGWLLRGRRILGARAHHHRQYGKHQRQAQLARRDEANGHVRCSPAPAITQDTVRNKGKGMTMAMTITIPLAPWGRPATESMLRIALIPELRLQRGYPVVQNRARDDDVDRQERGFDRRKDLAHCHPHPRDQLPVNAGRLPRIGHRQRDPAHTLGRAPPGTRPGQARFKSADVLRVRSRRRAVRGI